MKATEANLLDFLKKSPQFVIPIYQRTYSRTEPQRRKLWNDYLRAVEGLHLAGHKTFNQPGSRSGVDAERRLHE
jgi:uncharacterized protein with ParB-like and HNH nuclease domain